MMRGMHVVRICALSPHHYDKVDSADDRDPKSKFERSLWRI